MTRTKKVYVLYNEELGYTDACPVYAKQSDAQKEAACKCREHSVQKRNISDFKPCHSNDEKHCASCAIWYKNYKS